MLPRMNMAEGGAADAAPDEAPSGAQQLPLDSLGKPVDPDADVVMPHGCPFLLAETGGWRLNVATRDHRCAAVRPPAALSLEKQSRLCLTQAHTSCATYLASMSARGARVGTQAVTDRSTRWGLTRTTTVIEDAGGLRSRIVGLVLDRRRWPAIPAVLLVVTLLVLAVSGLRGGTPVATAGPTRPAITSTPSSKPTAAPTEAPTSSPEPEATPTAPPTPAPSPTPAATRPAATFRTYRVKSGDTLSAIAAKYGTTSFAIANLNGISVNSILSVGQILKIPNP
jgi:LysM repeat protein